MTTHVAIGARFERIVHSTLSSSFSLRFAGGPGDAGIDLRGNIAQLPHVPVLVQCKRLSGKVPSSTARELIGTLARHPHCDSVLGILASNHGFTRACIATLEGAPVSLAAAVIPDAEKEKGDEHELLARPLTLFSLNRRARTLHPCIRVSQCYHGAGGRSVSLSFDKSDEWGDDVACKQVK